MNTKFTLLIILLIIAIVIKVIKNSGIIILTTNCGTFSRGMQTFDKDDANSVKIT